MHNPDPLPVLHQLFESLDKDIAKLSDNKLLTRIAKQIEQIGIVAGKDKLHGFRNLCNLIHLNILQVDADVESIYGSHRSLLKPWSSLARNYLNATDDNDTVNALIQHIQDPRWHTPLSSNDYQVFLDMFNNREHLKHDEALSEITSAQIDRMEKDFNNMDDDDLVSFQHLTQQVEGICHSTSHAKPKGLHTIYMQLSENLNLIASQNKTITPVQKTLLQSIIGLTKNFLADPTNEDYYHALIKNLDKHNWPGPISVVPADNTLLTQLDALNENILEQEEFDAQALTAIATEIEDFSTNCGNNSYLGLQDIGLLLSQNLANLSVDGITLSTVQKQFVSDWPILVKTYLYNMDDPGLAEPLITAMQDTDWPSPLSDVDTGIIREMFDNVPIHSNAGIVGTDEIVTGDEEDDGKHNEISKDTINHDIPHSIDESSAQGPFGDTGSSPIEKEQGRSTAANMLLTQLDALNQLILEQDDLDTASITAIATELEEFSITCADAGYLGLQDIALLLSQNLIDVSADGTTLNTIQKQFVSDWETLVKTYLADPGMAESLITPMQDAEWPSPLAKIDSGIIREMCDHAPIHSSDDTANTEKTLAEIETNDENTTNNHEEDENLITHAVSKELTDMLQSEIVDMGKEINECMGILSAEDIKMATRHDLLCQITARIERFGDACQAADLTGIHILCKSLHNNLSIVEQSTETISQQQYETVQSWLQHIEAYLGSLGDPIISQTLADIIQSDCWAVALPQNELSALINVLKSPYLVASEIKEARQIKANPDDVRIELQDDINQELLHGLLQELPASTENLAMVFQRILDGNEDLEEIEKAQRIAHTIKGAASTVGVRGIANLTHHLEDILVIFTQQKSMPNRESLLTLINTADCLQEMCEALIREDTTPVHAQQVLQEVLDLANRLDNDVVTEQLTDRPSSIAAPETSTDENNAIEERATTPTVRVRTTMIDDVLRVMGETMIITSQLQEKIKLTSTENSILKDKHFQLQQLTSDLERQVEFRSNTVQLNQAVNQSEVFDPLELEHYNELHTVVNQLVETTTDAREQNEHMEQYLTALDELVIKQRRLHKEAAELVMDTRMVPIRTIIPRLQRSIRQTCRVTGKQARLDLKGTDTLIDSDILNDLVDPLMHIMRNAVDHGIESPQERIRNHKDVEGRVELSVIRDGTYIIIRCHDDGAGLDLKAIRQTALERGLMDVDDEMTAPDLARVILQPGFTTKNTTTHTSGRGIGLDVVLTRLFAIKGSIHIDTEDKNGTLIELRIPVTLMSSHAVLVRSQKQILAISRLGIDQIIHPSDADISETEDGFLYELNDEQLDAISLESLIKLPTDRRLDPRHVRPALLVRDDDLKKAVLVEEVFDSQDIVIKSMGKYLSGLKGILGATILGNGSIVPVFDLPDLIRNKDKEDVHGFQSTELTQTLPRPLPFALVVDDSLSARRSLTQIMRDTGYYVRTAKDGLEAIEIIEKKAPQIIIVDFEMPRMNGIELCSYIRTNNKTKHLPIIMITSRTTAKHRNIAESAGVNLFLTKPFSEDTFLDNVQSLMAHSIQESQGMIN